MAVQPIPKGYHSVTPYLVVNDATRAIDFYKRAFGAEQIVKMDGPDGKIAHAELKIGDSVVMLSDEMPGAKCRAPRSLGGTSCGIFLYVNDVDAVFRQAQNTGARVETPLADMFWGDRFGQLSDPFGHLWSVATHKEDVAPEEMRRRGKEAMEKMAHQHAETVSR